MFPQMSSSFCQQQVSKQCAKNCLSYYGSFRFWKKVQWCAKVIDLPFLWYFCKQANRPHLPNWFFDNQFLLHYFVKNTVRKLHQIELNSRCVYGQQKWSKISKLSGKTLSWNSSAPNCLPIVLLLKFICSLIVCKYGVLLFNFKGNNVH